MGSVTSASFFSTGMIFCAVAVVEIIVSGSVLTSGDKMASNFSSTRLGSSLLLSTCSALEALFFDTSLFLKVAAGMI